MTDILRVQKEDVDVNALITATRDAKDGAQLVFVGCVRDDGLEGLEIEAFVPAAEADLRKIADEAETIPGVRAVHIVHRYGKLAVGETIVVTIVCAAHRGEAYEASRLIIERIKEYVPIWKQELRKDGTKQWIEEK